jgi:hypothetical protein
MVEGSMKSYKIITAEVIPTRVLFINVVCIDDNTKGIARFDLNKLEEIQKVTELGELCGLKQPWGTNHLPGKVFSINLEGD